MNTKTHNKMHTIRIATSDISLKIGVPSPTQFHIACSILQLCDVIQYYLNFEHNAQNSKNLLKLRLMFWGINY